MVRSIPIRIFQSLLVLAVLLGASAVRSPSLLAQATATIQASARVVSTDVPQAGQSNGLSLAQETLEVASRGVRRGVEMRRELNGAALVATLIVPENEGEQARQSPTEPPTRETLVRVTVHYAAN